MKKVLIIDPLLKQYRVRFIEELYQALQKENVQLQLVYADPRQRELQKSDNVEIDVRFGTKTKMSWFLNGRVGYQHVFKEIINSDLVIMEHSYKYLITYLNLLLSTLRLKKAAFWGHGYNRQASRINLAERIKMLTLNRVDWWFAYTKGVAEYLTEKGVPRDKITVVQNTVDMEEFQKELATVDETKMTHVRQQLDIPTNASIGLFCGGLYPEKRLSFLLEAAILIQKVIPDFHLLIVGGGEERALVESAARNLPWIHYLGPQFGRDKALSFKMAHLFLHPGAIGLAILDSFEAGLPLITCEIPTHGPEIDYLEDNVNGLITAFDINTYAETVISLLEDEELLMRLSNGAKTSAILYSLDTMVDNFKTGILACLAK